MRFDSSLVRTLTQPASDRLNMALRWRKPAYDGLLALVVTDLESFTTWVSKLGDAQARLWMREHNRLAREAVEHADGHEVTHTGDGLIAAFRSLNAALRCTQQIQRSMAAYSHERPYAPLSVRVGVHAGEPLPEDGRLIGSCVNTAVRVCATAGAGQTLVTEVVRQLAQGRGFEFSEYGEANLKGLPSRVRLYELLTAHPVVMPKSA